ncbi:glutaredoxin [Lepidopterella palustris CBS 459.81]|uniref:Glutaredoxin n=1 Tax=Lepidopterella palustris CBS 459.81 TaxID=1314670 RepID=A0A8E2JCZ8_9PEZI|nr:glutaredoxin [Lepidopterella palustris CBS 459.81]
MPSQRRIKVFGLMILLAVLITLYMTSSARQTRTSDFYTKTTDALQAKEAAEAAKKIDAEDVGARLKAAEDAAKKAADVKDRKLQEAVTGEDGTGGERSVAGRVMMKDQEEKVPGVAGVGGRPADRQAAKQKQEPETEEDHDVEVELNAILKKSPIIIFSKTFCPFSKKAKQILLQQYKIVPPPYVVELNEHPLGAALQSALGKSTGRKTVPNVLINGRSIGGGDDIEALHQRGKLIDTVKSLGAKRIVEATLIEVKSKEEVKR